MTTSKYKRKITSYLRHPVQRDLGVHLYQQEPYVSKQTIQIKSYSVFFTELKKWDTSEQLKKDNAHVCQHWHESQSNFAHRLLPQLRGGFQTGKLITFLLHLAHRAP